MTDNTPDEPLVPASPDPVAAANAASDPQPLEGQLDTSRNWMGIVALVSGIVGFVIAAIVFGILGLSAAKNRKATNRGTAKLGIILACVWAVVQIGVIVALVMLANDSNEERVDGLAIGACYVSTTGGGGAQEDLVEFGPCTDATNATVYYVTSYVGANSPADADFAEDVWGICSSQAAISNITGDSLEGYYVDYYAPYADAWETSPHTLICALATDVGPVDPELVAG